MLARRQLLEYLLPGVLLVTIASGIAYTALRLFTDVSGGIVERFQSMPIARSAILGGHVLTSVVANLVSVAVVVAVAVAMGFRSGAGVLAWLAVAGILVLVTLALNWLAVIRRGEGRLRRRRRVAPRVGRKHSLGRTAHPLVPGQLHLGNPHPTGQVRLHPADSSCLLLEVGALSEVETRA